MSTRARSPIRVVSSQGLSGVKKRGRKLQQGMSFRHEWPSHIFIHCNCTVTTVSDCEFDQLQPKTDSNSPPPPFLIAGRREKAALLTAETRSCIRHVRLGMITSNRSNPPPPPSTAAATRGRGQHDREQSNTCGARFFKRISPSRNTAIDAGWKATLSTKPRASGRGLLH